MNFRTFYLIFPLNVVYQASRTITYNNNKNIYISAPDYQFMGPEAKYSSGAPHEQMKAYEGGGGIVNQECASPNCRDFAGKNARKM